MIRQFDNVTESNTDDEGTADDEATEGAKEKREGEDLDSDEAEIKYWDKRGSSMRFTNLWLWL